MDKATLQHRGYPNVFGIGDINGTTSSKTAATVKKSAPLVVHIVVPATTRSSLEELAFWVDRANLGGIALGIGAAALVFARPARVVPLLNIIKR